MMKTLYFFIIGFAITLLTACGQSGSLYLSSPQTRAEHPHDTFILGDDNTKKQKDSSSSKKQNNAKPANPS